MLEIPDWQDYQEEAATFFRGLGLAAETDVTLQGVRSAHDVDVVVKAEFVGFSMLWIVECKHWRSAVSKLHVLALREIVSDLGADRGVLLAESGFQRGALEAARLTNVQLTSLSDLAGPASVSIGIANLQDLHDRLDKCRRRYWSIRKEVRIEVGLRPPVGAHGFSSNRLFDAVEFGITSGVRGKLPIEYDEVLVPIDPRYMSHATSPLELYEELAALLATVERLLDIAETTPGHSR